MENQKKQNILTKVSYLLDTVFGAACVFLLAAMVITTSAQIICRVLCTYVEWIKPLSWSEELTRYMLIWLSFFGATCVYRHNGNIAITVVQQALPKPVAKALEILVHVICLVLFIVLMKYAIRYIGKQTRKAACLPIKMSTAYMCIPISLGALIYHSFTMIIEGILGWKKEEVKE